MGDGRYKNYKVTNITAGLTGFRLSSFDQCTHGRRLGDGSKPLDLPPSLIETYTPNVNAKNKAFKEIIFL
jgi:hypothetical protein